MVGIAPAEDHMTDHWLIRTRLAERTGPGAVSLLEGMNAGWSGSNWRFTTGGAVLLFVLGIAAGIACGIIGRWFVVHA